MIDILIPTYCRANFLSKNLEHLQKIVESGFEKKVRIIISNNNSTDGTRSIIDDFVEKSNLNFDVTHQGSNIGGLENTNYVLSRSTADYCMFLGDDDYIHADYIKRIFEIIENDDKAYFIVPSFYLIDMAGKKLSGSGRATDLGNAKYGKGHYAVKNMVYLAHQMSGLVFKRELFVKRYFELRLNSMYPFMFFASMCCMMGNSYLVTDLPVLVTHTPQYKKDWDYGDNGLIIDKFKCFYYAFDSCFLRFCLEQQTLFIQAFSILSYVRKSPFAYIKLHYLLLVSPYATFWTKILLFPFMMVVPILQLPRVLKLGFGKLTRGF